MKVAFASMPRGRHDVIHPRLNPSARELFDDFAGAARRVTTDFYTRHLELPMQRLRMVSVADVLAEVGQDGTAAPA